MADERLTKKERREKRRLERREQEAQEARAQRRRRILTIAGTIAAVAGIAAIFWFTREPPLPEDAVVVQAAEAEEAYEAAGCAPVDIPPPASTQHLDEPAPSADELYAVRPTHSGPHFSLTAPVGAFDEYVDERETTHNLEHGSVAVWWDPEQAEDTGAIKEWTDTRMRMGFSAGSGQMGSGAGIIAAPFERSLSTGKAVAIRAWGVALDCDQWDQTVADAFLASNYGTRGQAPERTLAPYPDEALRIEGTVEQPTADATAGTEPAGDEPTAQDTTATEPEASPTG